MVPAFFRMLRHFPRRRLRIQAKGFARPYRTPCLFVGNNEYGMELFTFGKRERLDAGKLWFYVVKPRNPAEFFAMVWRLCFGHLDQARDLDKFELAEAEISAKASRLPVALDGEVKIMHTPLHYRSRPRALRVLVPRGAAKLTAGARECPLEAGANRLCSRPCSLAPIRVTSSAS